MEYNTILRRLRYALNYNDEQMKAVFAAGGRDLEPLDIANMLMKEEEDDFMGCDSRTLEQFLDGLIVTKRGPSEKGLPLPSRTDLTNNMILKKLRIALELREEGMLEVFEKGGAQVSKPELTALFRKIGHKHYRSCGDQLMRQFLSGLSTN